MRLPFRLRMYARPNSKRSKPCREISIPGNIRGEPFETNPFKCPTGVLRIATRAGTLPADVPSVVHSSDNSTITETSLGSVTAMFALVSIHQHKFWFWFWLFFLVALIFGSSGNRQAAWNDVHPAKGCSLSTDLPRRCVRRGCVVFWTPPTSGMRTQFLFADATSSGAELVVFMSTQCILAYSRVRI